MKYFVMIVAAIALGACGNTISGVGQDIKDMGGKMTTWQNKKDVKPKPVTVGPRTSNSLKLKGEVGA